MTPNPGKLYVVLIVSVLLSCIAAWIIAGRYRRRMQQLMRTPNPHTAEAGTFAVAAPDAPPSYPASLVDNHRAGMRLTMLLVALSCLLAATSACSWWALSFPGEPMPPKRVAIIALLHLWPVVLALALMWRWSRKRLFGTLLLWCGVTFMVLLWRQIEPNPMQAFAVMASEIGLSLVLLSLVFLSDATRAIAPWLLMPAAFLVSSLLAGLDVLTYMAEHESPFLTSLIAPLEGLPSWSGVVMIFVLFLLLAGIIAWWPVRMLGRALWGMPIRASGSRIRWWCSPAYGVLRWPIGL